MIKAAGSQVVMSGLPFPPSENQAYVNNTGMGARGRGRFSSVDAKEFKFRMLAWALNNRVMIEQARQIIAGWQTPASLSIFLGFRHDRVWKKNGGVKRIDASNFVKLLQDSVTTALGIDDSNLWATSVEKAALPKGRTVESCIAILTPAMPRDLDEWKDHLGIV